MARKHKFTCPSVALHPNGDLANPRISIGNRVFYAPLVPADKGDYQDHDYVPLPAIEHAIAFHGIMRRFLDPFDQTEYDAEHGELVPMSWREICSGVSPTTKITFTFLRVEFDPEVGAGINIPAIRLDDRLRPEEDDRLDAEDDDSLDEASVADDPSVPSWAFMENEYTYLEQIMVDPRLEDLRIFLASPKLFVG